MLICAATGVPAQTAYSQADVTGPFTFTDRPDTIPLPITATVLALELANALTGNSVISSRRPPTIDANEAARRRGQVQPERKPGAKLQPDKQARDTKATVVNQRYLRRQEKLRHWHERAQRRSSEFVRLLRPGF